MCAYGYTHRKGRPVRRHAKPRYAYYPQANHQMGCLLIEALSPRYAHCPQADHRQLERLLIEPCHTFVALSDRWISTSSLGLSMNANEHNQLTSPILMSTTPCVCLWVYT